jgi:hypothetical protein
MILLSFSLAVNAQLMADIAAYPTKASSAESN